MTRSSRNNWLYLVSLLAAVLLTAPLVLPEDRPGPVPVGQGEAGELAMRPPKLDCETDRLLEPQFPYLEGDDVLGIQERLRELGYYLGELNGVYSQTTIDAVRRWHRDHGMGDSAVVDGATRESLTDPESATNLETKTEAPKPPPEDNPSLVIDVPKKKLSLFYNGVLFKEYPVATGRGKTPTPVGDWKVNDKGVNWGGGFGTRWLGINVPWGIFGIHGTNEPWSIGRAASHGCIRMRNRDVEELYRLVPIGTPVKITGEPVKWVIPRQMGPGSSGREVAILQNRLIQFGFDPGLMDGRLGPSTIKAILELEHFYGLEPDGKAGSNLQIIIGIR